MRRNRKLDYIIMALFCLVMLNIGSIIIEFHSFGDSNIRKNKTLDIISVSTNYIRKNFSLNKMINQVVSSVFLVEETPIDSYDDFIHEDIENIEEKEARTEEDIIIQDLDEYDSLIIIKDSNGKNSIENLPKPINIANLEVDEEKPYILIYHTHATESFMPARENNFHVSDKKYNILGIGEIVTTVLEASGHKVDHDHTYHDLPSYNKSYSRSLSTVNKKMEESNNLKVLLDFHRDGVEENSPNISAVRKKSKINIDGKEVATFSLVIGPDSEKKDQVLSFAKYIKAVSDTLYPGLCRGILIKPVGKYNQHKSDYSALFEVGYNINTIEEATEGAKLIGEILSLALDNIKNQ